MFQFGHSIVGIVVYSGASASEWVQCQCGDCHRFIPTEHIHGLFGNKWSVLTEDRNKVKFGKKFLLSIRAIGEIQSATVAVHAPPHLQHTRIHRTNHWSWFSQQCRERVNDCVMVSANAWFCIRFLFCTFRNFAFGIYSHNIFVSDGSLCAAKLTPGMLDTMTLVCRSPVIAIALCTAIVRTASRR